MGIYNVVCPVCDTAHLWFSGTTNMDQRCQKCKSTTQSVSSDTQEKPMIDTQELIDALKNVIAVQNDLIAHLKADVERLKASQIAISQPNIGGPSIYPIMPYNPLPLIPNTHPINPLQPPWTITSVGDTPGSVGFGHTGPCAPDCRCSNGMSGNVTFSNDGVTHANAVKGN